MPDLPSPASVSGRQAAAIPAAALIVMAEVGAGPPLLLIVRRSNRLAFAGGAFVFPGGRVDPADREAAAPAGLDGDDAAARQAGLRETCEETGIDLSRSDAGLAALVPFARWRPPVGHAARRFDTRFYLARARACTTPVADGMETAAAFWASAADVLRSCDAGEGHVIFPTRRLLERLSRFGSFAEACADARRWPERIISPCVERIDGSDWLCIPQDAGYPVCREPLSRAIRG